MADIELVIKIPEKEYESICLMSKDGIGMALYDWVANGIPLEDIVSRIEAEKNKLNEEGELHYSKSEIAIFDKCLGYLKG